MHRLAWFGILLALAHPAGANPNPVLLEPEAWKLFPDFRTTDIRHRPDGSGELFVVSRHGLIVCCDPATNTDRIFLDLSNRVERHGEGGLLSLAFPPGPTASDHFYVFYTFQEHDGRGWRPMSRVSRFPIDQASGLGDPLGEEPILTFPRAADRHNGGHLRFGTDGNLFISVGDNRDPRDLVAHAQDTSNLLGSLLRIDPEGAPPGTPYLIPPDNPLLGDPSARPEIIAWGLHNPRSFRFDPATGNLLLSDTGDGLREELNVIPPPQLTEGLNFGWPHREGTHERSEAPGKVLTEPLLEHDSTSNSGWLVGPFSQDPAIAPGCVLLGQLHGRLSLLANLDGSASPAIVGRAPDRLACLGEDEAGTIYGATWGGLLFSLRPTTALGPVSIYLPASNALVDRATLRLDYPNPGAVLRYTLDGSDPGPSSPAYDSQSRLTVTDSALVKARAFHSSLPPGPVAALPVTLTTNTVTATTDSLESDPVRVITLQTTTPEAVIRYTTDQSHVTETSPVYDPDLGLPLTRSTTLKFRAYREGWNPGGEGTATFTLQAGTPELVGLRPADLPNLPLYHPLQFTSQTPGTTFHYTLDETRPTPDSPRIEGPLHVPPGAPLRVIAFRGEMEPSESFIHRPFGLSPRTGTRQLVATPAPLTDLEDVMRSPSGILAVTDRDHNLWILRPGEAPLGFPPPRGSPSKFAFNAADALFAEEGPRITRADPPDYQTETVVLPYLNELRSFVPDHDGGFLVADKHQSNEGFISHIYRNRGTPSLGFVVRGMPVMKDMDLFPNGDLALLISEFYSDQHVVGIVRNGEYLPIVEPTRWGNFDGTLEVAGLVQTEQILADRLGNMYVSCYHRPDFRADAATIIRKISPDGRVGTLAGPTLAADGTPVDSEQSILSVEGRIDIDDRGVLHGTDGTSLWMFVQEDWDNDGISDDTEREAGGHLEVGVDDRSIDSNGNGLSNAADFLFGSTPGPAARRVSENRALLAFPVEPGSECHLQFSDDGHRWHSMSHTLTATFADVVFSVGIMPAVQSRLFRCVVN